MLMSKKSYTIATYKYSLYLVALLYECTGYRVWMRAMSISFASILSYVNKLLVIKGNIPIVMTASKLLDFNVISCSSSFMFIHQLSRNLYIVWGRCFINGCLEGSQVTVT